MRLDLYWIPAVALIACSAAQAQIYVCTAPDGTRVYSDERCGPDAKVVPGITSKKRSAPSQRPAMTQKSQEELEELTRSCDAGDLAACRAWTFGGGPNLLREQERKAELACEGGSLAACEERYCRDGLDARCRERVLQTASVSGDSWYLREQRSGQQDGATRYAIRCVPAGARRARDLFITCASQPGPNRCYAADSERGFSRLDLAAAAHCSS